MLRSGYRTRNDDYERLLRHYVPRNDGRGKMYADVVVLTYQSPEIGIYTYQIPSELKNSIKVGQLVEVPFGSRAPYGIVIAIKAIEPTNVIKIRPIIGLALAKPLLLPYQIELLRWMANYYAAPLVNCLEAMLPPLTRKSLIVNGSSGQKIHPINDKQSTMNQTLVLVPSINRIPETLAKFPQAKNYVLFHNQLKVSEIFAAWMQIITGEVDFIFGSRSAIFSPCPSLAKIIIFDEHDGAYKDERSPYFDTLLVAEKIQKLTSAKLEIIDSAPKITTYFSHDNDLQIPKNPLPKTVVVSMIDERNAGNKSPISDVLSNLLVRNYKSGGKSLLFLNKKIESGQYSCRNCNHQAYVKVRPASCPNCNSPDLFFYSLNIASLSNLVRVIVPSVGIKLIAEGVSPALSGAPIHIATSTIFYAQTIAKYELVAHIAPDNVANIPDFNSAEKAYAQITNLKKITAKNGVLILQTYNPDSTTIKSAASGDYQRFAKEQQDMRKTLTYPPYAILVKLTIRGTNLDKLSQKAQSLFTLLDEFKDNSTFILGPYQPFFAKNPPRYNIILKKKLESFSLGEREKATRDLTPLLAKINPDWQIIIDPDSLN